MVSEEDIKNMSPEQIAELQKQNCIFCKIIKGEIPSKKVHEDTDCIAVLDINPANEGHVIIIPKEHFQIMPQVSENILGHMFIIAKKVSKAILMSTLGKSTSIFVANGAAAGQKAPHFMIHVIPRKDSSEFLSIPTKDASESDLEKLRQAIVSKLKSVLGKEPIPKTADENKSIQERVDDKQKQQEPKDINEEKKDEPQNDEITLPIETDRDEGNPNLDEISKMLLGEKND